MAIGSRVTPARYCSDEDMYADPKIKQKTEAFNALVNPKPPKEERDRIIAQKREERLMLSGDKHE